MGQARNRKAEIDQLKAQGAKVKPKKLMFFGAFYKDDTDDGVSVCFDNMSNNGVMQILYDQIQPMVDRLMGEIQSGEWTVAEVRAQLHHAIRSFNMINFKSEVRPPRGIYPNKNLMESMNEIIIIMGNVWLLEKLGEIKSDEFNGMMFAYSN